MKTPGKLPPNLSSKLWEASDRKCSIFLRKTDTGMPRGLGENSVEHLIDGVRCDNCLALFPTPGALELKRWPESSCCNRKDVVLPHCSSPNDERPYSFVEQQVNHNAQIPPTTHSSQTLARTHRTAIRRTAIVSQWSLRQRAVRLARKSRGMKETPRSPEKPILPPPP